MIAWCQKVDPLRGIIKDVTRWLKNAGHPQIRRELLHHLCEMCGERMWVAYQGTCTGRRIALPQGEFGLDVIALVGALHLAEHRIVPEIHRKLLGRITDD